MFFTAKEKVVGWYSTGPKIKPADLGTSPLFFLFCLFGLSFIPEINELIRNYTPNPVLVVITANPTDDLAIPTEAYFSVENVAEVCPQSSATDFHSAIIPSRRSPTIEKHLPISLHLSALLKPRKSASSIFFVMFGYRDCIFESDFPSSFVCCRIRLLPLSHGKSA